MTFGKTQFLTRIGMAVAAAAFMLSLSMGVADSVSAQTPPATFYGKGLRSGDRVEAFIGANLCGSATVNAAGEWSIPVPANAPCNPTEGAAVTFRLNGAPATAVPAAVWRGGGLPPDVANGYVLTAAAATPTAAAPTVVAPKTGNAGMLGGGNDATSGWIVLTLGLIALGAVAGTRAYARRGVR